MPDSPDKMGAAGRLPIESEQRVNLGGGIVTRTNRSWTVPDWFAEFNMIMSNVWRAF